MSAHPGLCGGTGQRMSLPRSTLILIPIGQSCSLFFANALQYASRLTANLPVRYTSHGSPGL